jgi:hypothetical protein
VTDETKTVCQFRHWLVVTEFEGERDYEIEHDGCPTEEWETGLDGVLPVVEHSCDVGQVWSAVGRDAVSDIEDITPGRYPISIHVEHYPSLPTNDGEEWDVWLAIAE